MTCSLKKEFAYDFCFILVLFQKMAYTTDNSSINVTWEGFEDFQSGISTFEVSLWKNKTCQKNSEIVLVTDWLTLSRNYSFYQLVDQQLEVKIRISLIELFNFTDTVKLCK